MKIGFALPLLNLTLPLLWFTLLSSLSTSLPYCFPVIPPLPIPSLPTAFSSSFLFTAPFFLPIYSLSFIFNCSLHHLSSLCVPILLHLISPILFKCLVLLTYMYTYVYLFYCHHLLWSLPICCTSKMLYLLYCRHCLHVHHWRAPSCKDLPEQTPRCSCQCICSFLLLCCGDLLHFPRNCEHCCNHHKQRLILFLLHFQYFDRKNTLATRIILVSILMGIVVVYFISMYYFHQWQYGKWNSSCPCCVIIFMCATLITNSLHHFLESYKSAPSLHTSLEISKS